LILPKALCRRRGTWLEHRVQLFDSRPERRRRSAAPRFPSIDDGSVGGANSARKFRLSQSQAPAKPNETRSVVRRNDDGWWRRHRRSKSAIPLPLVNTYELIDRRTGRESQRPPEHGLGGQMEVHSAIAHRSRTIQTGKTSQCDPFDAEWAAFLEGGITHSPAFRDC
jgi:hypothetical protein